MTIAMPFLAFAGVTILFHNMKRLGRSVGQRDADRLEWYLAEARAYYDQPRA